MIQLRDYQQNIINKVSEHLLYNKRCCVSLATGGGKTVIFSSLVPKLEGKTLICVHREELVHQTSRTLTMDHDLIISKSKKDPIENVAVAMVQTLWSRIKRSKIDVNDYDNIIIDECHRGEFMKVLELFKGNVIGFTATPNYEKTIYFYKCLKCGNEADKAGKCCNNKLKKYKSNIPLAQYYDTLIEGVEINDLIEREYLVKDENYVLDIDTSILVFDPKKNDYTEESIGLVFGSDEAIHNTVKVYKELVQGKKTILFNPNTLVNKKLYDAMKSEGINCKMYDSNNTEEHRLELVEWFSNTPDAVLLNVQVFTTGFDCTDVEVVFLNKKTKSINLFLQMVGRGGRITDKILKPSFRVIDMGNNNEDFGNWSDKRDWKPYFYDKEIKAVGPVQPTAVSECHSCAYLMSANSLICPNCGAEKQFKGGVTGLPKMNGKPIIPTPNKIIQYCEKNNLDTLQARKIVYNYGAMMFEDVKIETFKKHKANGNLYREAKNYFIPYYFAIQKSKLEGNRVRTLESFVNEIIKKIERRYEH
jgi:superfamily II DNA or RNA helicase